MAARWANSSVPSEPLPGTFRRLLGAWFTSLAGDGLRLIALPLLAAALSPTPGAVAAVAAAAALPWLLVAIPSGVWVDRNDPVRAAITADVLRALCAAALAVSVIAGWATIPLLCIFGFLMTSAETVADSASQSLLVAVVAPAELERANSRFTIVQTLALDMMGPLGGGVAFTIARWLPFALAAVGFVSSAALMAGLPRQRIEPEAIAGSADSILAQIRQGLRQLFTDTVLRTLVITVAVMAMANAAQDGVLVIYATSSLKLSSAMYPTLLVAYSVGTLLSAVLVGRIVARFRGGRVMLVALTGIGASLLVMGLVPHPWVAWACYGLMGLAGGTWNVLSASRRQRRTPRQMVARVSSAFRVVAWGITPIGAAFGGLAGSRLGVPAVFVMAGSIILVLGAVVFRSFYATEPAPEPAGLLLDESG